MAAGEFVVESIRSANTVGDAPWIIENFTPADQAEVETLLSDPAVAKRNQDYYKTLSKAEIVNHVINDGEPPRCECPRRK